jgi:glyoxylate utilization-related uncharacterized protein
VRSGAVMAKACLVSVAFWSLTNAGAMAQAAMAGKIQPYGSLAFGPDADVACLASALEAGEAATGPSTWILKAPSGCLVPWHSHTAQEQLIVVGGSVMAEMTGHAPTLLEAGGFAVMPGRMAHQFTCQETASCVMFVSFDRAYDIKWEKAPR